MSLAGPSVGTILASAAIVAAGLKQLVHFYNTRDLFAFDVESGHCPPGTTEKVDCWPRPETPQNLDCMTGNLGLTDEEEDQIVAFLQTLTDGFTTPYPNIDTFTGTCATGGDAATQGNEVLIPTPPLPPCSPLVCGVEPLPLPTRLVLPSVR
jgi:cytochrome c peroxidase